MQMKSRDDSLTISTLGASGQRPMTRQIVAHGGESAHTGTVSTILYQRSCGTRRAHQSHVGVRLATDPHHKVTKNDLEPCNREGFPSANAFAVFARHVWGIAFICEALTTEGLHRWVRCQVCPLMRMSRATCCCPVGSVDLTRSHA